jgi:glycine cleavage system H protein
MMRALDYEVPDKLYYSKEHEWVKLEGKEAVVGITDYAQKQLHDIVYVEVKKVGVTIEQFQTMGTVESVKSASDIYSPVSGEVTKVNEKLAESPELLNQDPYGKGWLARVSLKDFDKDVKKLLTAQQYVDHIKSMEK